MVDFNISFVKILHLWTLILNENASPLWSDLQLTPDAEQKVVQSRELLDTIVKENKGEHDIHLHKENMSGFFC